MISVIESFGHLMIARRAGGEPVRLVRSPDEMVFLAFDVSIKRLVELHILRSGDSLDSVAKKSAFDRAKQASAIRGPTFMRILDVGEEQGLVYYTSNLNDGEFIEDYILRRGPLQPAIVFSLVFQMLDDLLQLKDYRRLVSQMRLDRVVMTTLEDTFLQLRIYDYGLSANETEDPSEANLVVQVCELVFLMLTGKTYEGDNPDRYHSLTSLPMSLRTTMRAALTDPTNAPASLERLRDEVRETIGAFVSGIQARNTRKQLVVITPLQPRSQLQDLLLENVPIETILGNRFRVEGENDARRYPFSIPSLNMKNDQPVMVHLLPPSRIVDKTQYEALPLQMWRFNAEKHPNILRSHSLWESPDWTFLTEEREPGFSLSRLLAERITLNPQEVAILLRQIQAGQEQALECGVQRLDLHPSNIVLRVGKNGPLVNREHERLMQKRLDAWPPFRVKLRAHLTMRNLYEPPLVDKPEHGEHAESHLADRDYRHRAFVSLATYLLTGQRLTTGVPKFPEATPELLADFIRECLEKSRHHGQTPNPLDFLLQFEGLMHATSTQKGLKGLDLASRLRGASVPVEQMESVGSVSDFDNEWAEHDDTDTEDDLPLTPISRQLKPTDFTCRSNQHRSAWHLWAAAAVTIFGFAGWLVFSGNDIIPPQSSTLPTIREEAAQMVQVQPETPSTLPEPASDPVVVTQVETPLPPAIIVPDPVSLDPVVKPVFKPVMAANSETVAPAPAKPEPVVAAAPPEVPAPVVAAAAPEMPAPVIAPAPAKPKPVVAAAPPEMPAPVVAPAPAKPKPVVAAAAPEVPAPVVAPAPTKPDPVVAAAPPEVSAPVAEVKKPELTVEPGMTITKAPEIVATPPPALKPKPVVTIAPGSEPSTKPDTPPATITAAPIPQTKPATKETVPSAPAPPAPQAVPDPVIIRKAILPTPEEIARYKQGLAKPPPPQLPAQVRPQPPADRRSGSIPTINVAQPVSEDAKSRQ